ncbi:PREDICTED: class I histocompatibility antigen, Gogo-A*0201 alpha chain-like, partial [Hipposideros armiger]|uniref:Class I histocompatibility antigen, Gogo-A*0201 alpha chain-like n=1 Tax=Hipposideros armiger TaxID=186990 RepID=A0A8B7QPY4_HIPAR
AGPRSAREPDTALVSTGTHSLRYHYLALSEPGLGLPHFLAVGYVDDQPFIRYDSHVGRAQPQAPWMAPVDTQYWEMETKKHRSWEKVQQVEIWTLMSHYNQSGGMSGMSPACALRSRQPCLKTFTPFCWWRASPGESQVPISSLTSTMEDAGGAQDQTWGMGREGPLPAFPPPPLSAEAPMVQVTRLLTQDGDAMLRCWALGFYPRDISLSWWLGEEELTLETEHVETCPSGDGTYQTWAAVWVPAGEEARYTCHVQHSGLNHTLTVAWELPSHHGLIAMVVPLFLLLLVVGGAVVICMKRFPQGRWGRNKVGGPAAGPILWTGASIIPKAQQERGLLRSSADRISPSQTQDVSCGVFGTCRPLQ